MIVETRVLPTNPPIWVRLHEPVLNAATAYATSAWMGAGSPSRWPVPYSLRSGRASQAFRSMRRQAALLPAAGRQAYEAAEPHAVRHLGAAPHHHDGAPRHGQKRGTAADLALEPFPAPCQLDTPEMEQGRCGFRPCCAYIQIKAFVTAA